MLHQARSAETTIAVGDERGTHGQANKTNQPRTGFTITGKSHASWRRYAALLVWIAIRGFLEDSSPTAIVIRMLCIQESAYL